MLASDVILRARDTLADPAGHRWDDNRLLRLLDEAQTTICFRAKVLRDSTSIVVHPNQANYSLPVNANDLIRVKYKLNGIYSKLDIISADIADEILGDNVIPGIPLYAIKDNLNKEVIRLAPEPSFTENVPFDILLATTITVTYTRKPKVISAMTDSLDLDDNYKTMLVRYIVGNALRDDMDTQNRIVGDEELKMFEAWLLDIEKASSKDFTATHYETKYRPIG